MSKLADQIKKTGIVVRQRHTEDHPSMAFADKEGRLFRLAITSIKANPNQPRKFFDLHKLSELATSIRDKGVLQPILVREEKAQEDVQFIIVAGERRFRAAKEAGLIDIPAIITTGDPDEIAIIENLQRDNLKPVEEAEGLAQLMVTHGYNQEKLGEVVGKAKSTISEILSLTKLPSAIRDEVRSSELSKMILIEIAKQDTEEAMLELYKQIKKNGLKGYAVRDLTRNRKERSMNAPLEIALRKFKDLKKTVKKLEPSDIGEAGKQELLQVLDEINKLMNSLLN